MSGGPERRRHRRKNLSQKQVKVDLGFTTGVISDLSETGLCVRTPAPLKLRKGDRLHVTIPDSNRPIQAGCELAWAATNGTAGLRFLVLSKGSQDSIRSWMQTGEGTGTVWLPPANPIIERRVEVPVVGQQRVTSVIPKLEQPGSALEKSLRMLADVARLLTKADGAAIALEEEGIVVCRASTGNAPPVGTELSVTSSLSGECLRTGLSVRSDDTAVDLRVDAEACQRLKVRSIIAVPIFREGDIAGLIEVLSGAPKAFSTWDVLTLSQTAELLSSVVSQVAREAHEQAEQPASVPSPPIVAVAPAPSNGTPASDGQTTVRIAPTGTVWSRSGN
jgi:putative methionine-R-sulfoxide reductase with GAF domain